MRGARSVYCLSALHDLGGVTVLSTSAGIGSYTLLPAAGRLPYHTNDYGDTVLSLRRLPDDADGPL